MILQFPVDLTKEEHHIHQNCMTWQPKTAQVLTAVAERHVLRQRVALGEATVEEVVPMTPVCSSLGGTPGGGVMSRLQGLPQGRLRSP